MNAIKARHVPYSAAVATVGTSVIDAILYVLGQRANGAKLSREETNEIVATAAWTAFRRALDEHE